MPLTFADPGVENIIKKIGGNSEVRAHLTVVTSMAGNLIVNVKGARVAISREMASKIMI